MAPIDVKQLRKALESAGLEVFRVRGEEVHLAVRQNVQMMEARVLVRGGATPQVTVSSWAQRSDAATMPDDALFSLVRERAASLVDAGYVEQRFEREEIASVNDPAHLLDVWFSVTYARPVDSIEEAVTEAQRAIQFPRYVHPTR